MILHATEAGEGPPALLLHGLFGSARNFGSVQRRLAAGRRIVALDLRNHGASPHAAGMDYATMAADVAETMAALGLPACPVIGHSMGGKVAMRLALDRPGLVSRLLVADIAPVSYAPHFRAIADAMLAVPLAPGLTRAAADAVLAAAVPEPGLRGFLLLNLQTGPAPAWRIGLAEIAAALPEIEAWSDPGRQFAGPVLFLAGERSNYIRPEHRPAIRAAFPAARFATVRNAGHWLHADNPNGFLAVLDAFLPR